MASNPQVLPNYSLVLEKSMAYVTYHHVVMARMRMLPRQCKLDMNSIRRLVFDNDQTIPSVIIENFISFAREEEIIACSGPPGLTKYFNVSRMQLIDSENPAIKLGSVCREVPLNEVEQDLAKIACSADVECDPHEGAVAEETDPDDRPPRQTHSRRPFLFTFQSGGREIKRAFIPADYFEDLTIDRKQVKLDNLCAQYSWEHPHFNETERENSFKVVAKHYGLYSTGVGANKRDAKRRAVDVLINQITSEDNLPGTPAAVDRT